MAKQTERPILQVTNTGINDGTTKDQGTVALQQVVCNQADSVDGSESVVNTILPHSQPVVSVPVPITVQAGVSDIQTLTTGQIQLKVDANDGGQHSSVQEALQSLHGAANVTTASIITIPVVPYTVIGDSNGNEGEATTISVSLANADALSQLQDGRPLHQQVVSETQIVQQPPPPVVQQLSSMQQQQQQSTITHLTWEEAVSAAVLPVRCKDTNAELFKARFGSGNKGKCIKTGAEWFTPTEFEALCGRGNSKDWKRSIRFGGRTLQTLIDKGFLVPHASSCICSNCVDDAAATGPIRPFTPYQRKRKSQATDQPKGKLERLTSKDSTTDESSDIGTPGTPLGLSGNLNPLTQALMKMNQTGGNVSIEDTWKNLEDMVEKIVSASMLMKSMIQEMRERTNQEVESLRSQLAESHELQQFQIANAAPTVTHLQPQQTSNQVQNQITVGGIARNLLESPQILRIFDSNRIQTYSIEVLDPETFKQFQAAQSTTTKIICEDRALRPGNECTLQVPEIKTEVEVAAAQHLT